MSTSQSARSKNRRPRVLSRIVIALMGVVLTALAVPAAAGAQPLLPYIPGLPSIPGLPTSPSPTPPATKTPPPVTKAPTPPPVTTTPAAPADPAPPVATDTGWVVLADDATHQSTIWHNGKVVNTAPISMGSNAHPTPNGTYYTKEKYRSMYMDSSTYGVPSDSPNGYRTYVEYAIRMSWDGIFYHAAPWSVAQQGKTDVSHGCINVSTENGKFAYDNLPEGTPIVVRGTVGGQYVPGS